MTGICNAKSIFRSVVENDKVHLEFLIAYKRKENIVNAQNNHGMTPLHYAVMYRRNDMVQRLTAEGADWSIMNGIGQTPLDILWDSVPTEQASTRVLEIEKKLKECHKEEDRT